MNAAKIGFISLGCPKALVDSERILTQVRAEGYEIVPTYQDADLVVVNTCGFIDAAVEESLDAIGEALDENGKVLVTGCLGAKADVILEKYPNVLGITGPQAYESVMNGIHEHLPPLHDPHQSLIPPQGIKLTPRHYAYLKIAEGCNHKCTFCIIPDMRGKLASRRIDDVMREAEKLQQAGTRELLVVSQDTSAYGLDLKYEAAKWRDQDYRTSFLDLSKALGELDLWVRMHYVYPYPHVDDVIPLMAEGKILPYLDIPLQHASQSVLKNMKRPANRENTLARIKKWRSICPEITIRSTFIVGFPGETEQDFDELLAFLEEAQLDRVGCFTYSPVEGARANALPGDVPEEIKAHRLERFMAVQSEISTHKLKQKIGQTLEVLVDEVNEDHVVARSYADAPEIDGVVFIEGGQGLNPGQLVKVEITESTDHDLVGVL